MNGKTKYPKAIITNDYQLATRKTDNIPYKVINITQQHYTITHEQKRIFINNYIPLFFGNILVNELKTDQFKRTFYELDNAFCYPLIKPILDTIKKIFPNMKVYNDIKKIYTKTTGMKEYIRLCFYMNEQKNTINISLSC